MDFNPTLQHPALSHRVLPFLTASCSFSPHPALSHRIQHKAQEADEGGAPERGEVALAFEDQPLRNLRVKLAPPTVQRLDESREVLRGAQPHEGE